MNLLHEKLQTDPWWSNGNLYADIYFFSSNFCERESNIVEENFLMLTYLLKCQKCIGYIWKWKWTGHHQVPVFKKLLCKNIFKISCALLYNINKIYIYIKELNLYKNIIIGHSKAVSVFCYYLFFHFFFIIYLFYLRYVRKHRGLPKILI